MFVQAGHFALCVLTARPPLETLEFTEQLAQNGMRYGVDVYIIIDDDKFNFSSLKVFSHIRLLNISRKECISHGYQYTTHVGVNHSNVVAWDKALFHFSVLNKNYSFVWFVENDVLIPSTQSFLLLHQLYANDSDLVIPTTAVNVDGNATYWLWSEAVGKIAPPWSNAMVNFVGLSQRLLQAIAEEIKWRGRAPFHEFFFATTAIKLNMKIVTPFELNTIVFRQHVGWEHISKRPNNIWHPMKDPSHRSGYRKRYLFVSDSFINRHILFRVAEENSRRKSIDFLTDLEMLHHDIENMTKVEKNLKNFLAKFEISKGLISANNRRFIRQYFVNLAKQYRKEKNSDQAVLLAQELADHAYKLPEGK
jgi:hypothetical protein